jgi:hypothetical protein
MAPRAAGPASGGDAMSYQLIAIVSVAAAYLAALLIIAVAILVMEFRLYRKMNADDSAIMLTIRRMNREMMDILREGKP